MDVLKKQVQMTNCERGEPEAELIYHDSDTTQSYRYDPTIVISLVTGITSHNGYHNYHSVLIQITNHK